MNSFSSIPLTIEKGWTFSDIIKNAMNAVTPSKYTIYFSQVLREELYIALKETFYEKKEFYVHEEFYPFLKETSFLQWCKNEKKIAIPNFGELSNDTVSFSFGEKRVKYNLENKSLSLAGEIQFLKKLAFIRRNRKKLEACIRFLKCHPPWALKIKDTEIAVSLTISEEKIKITQTEQELSVRDIKNSVKTLIDANRTTLMEKAKACPYYGDLTAMAIVSCVIENDAYITKSSLKKILRGLESSQKYSDSEYYKKLAFVSNEYIQIRIDALIGSGIITAQLKKGSYGDFHVLKSNKCATYFLQYSTNRRKKTFSDYTEADWAAYLKKNLQNRSAKTTQKTDREQMILLEKKGVVCMYPDLVSAFLYTKPSYWKDYIETMYSVEHGAEKKYWKYLHSLLSDD